MSMGSVPARIFVVVTATLVLVLPGTVVADESDSIANKRIYFVVGNKDEDPANDDALIKRYLEDQGGKVTLATPDAGSDIPRNTDLVLVSSTASARIVRDAFKTTAVPIVTWNAYLYPELAMTGDELHRDFSVVRESVTHNLNHASFYSYCVNAEHPIAKMAGLPAGMFLNLMFSGETDMNWGRPTGAADIISISQGDPGKAAVFGYEKGALMANDFPAPARRVGVFLGDDSFRQLAYAEGPAARDPQQFGWYAGRRLFDAAILWALQEPRHSGLDRDDIASTLASLASGKRVLFLRRENLPWPDGERSDATHMRFLSDLGFELVVRDQTEPEIDVEGIDLVVISASTNKYKFGTKYADADVPVVLLEGKSVDAMYMAGRRRWTDYGTNDHKQSLYPPEAWVKIMRPHHTMSGGFPGGLLKIYDQPGLITWSIPAPGATIIATIPNQPKSAAIYGYEKGVTMANDVLAPAKRALFPVDFNRFHHLTEDGLALYRAVLLWSIN